MSVDLKGYKRGKMPNKAQLLLSLGNWKEQCEQWRREGDEVMENWSEGCCVGILQALGYEEPSDIVTRWRDEVVKGGGL